MQSIIRCIQRLYGCKRSWGGIWGILIFALMFSSCAGSYKLPAYPYTVEGFRWILGKWQFEGRDMYEEWTDNEDGQFYGSVFNKGKGEYKEIERIVLSSNGTEVFYLATVYGQNDGVPTPFKLVNYSKTSMRFENKNHDFPQSIHYKKISSDEIEVSLGAFIEGKLENRMQITLRKK